MRFPGCLASEVFSHVKLFGTEGNNAACGEVGVCRIVGVERNVRAAVVKADAVLNDNVGAGVGVDTLCKVVKCDGVLKHVLAGDALAAHLKAVTVTGLALVAGN